MDFKQLAAGVAMALVVSLLVACPSLTSHPHEGIVYHAGPETSYVLRPSCIREAKQAGGNTPAVQLALEPGSCTREFRQFMKSHLGERMTARLDGQMLSGPARIVHPFGSSFIQPVRFGWQRDLLIALFGQ